MAEAFKIPVMDCDGIAEVWVDSLDDWMSIVSDAEFVKEVAAGQLSFLRKRKQETTKKQIWGPKKVEEAVYLYQV